MAWDPGDVIRALSQGPTKTPGYVYRGLGLILALPPSPKGRRPAEWYLIHLGSGHAICRIKGAVVTAFPIASAIAECGDWDWDGLEGYKNKDPEIRERAVAVMNSFGKKVIRGNNGPSERIARDVALARA